MNTSNAPRALTVLWVSHFVPYPPVGGAYQRSFNLLDAVARRYAVHLVAIRHKAAPHGGVSSAEAERVLRSRCASLTVVDLTSRTRAAGVLFQAGRSLWSPHPMTVTMLSSSEMGNAVHARTTTVRPSVALFDSISVGQYRTVSGPTPAVLVHHNIESFMMRRRVQLEGRVVARRFFSLEAAKLERYEREHCPSFASNIVVSELDREALLRLAPAARVDVVENGVDTELFAPSELSDEPVLVFAGRLDQYANRDGILDFIDRAWPTLRAAFPRLRLRVVGMNPPRELIDRATPQTGVTVTGFVPDIRESLRHALAVVVPLRDGAGTRLKVLDAMALGLPIVATTVALEGIQAEPEQDVLVADNPEAFVRQVGRLLGSRGLRESLARNARRVAVAKYSWPQLGDKLANVLEQAAQCRSAPGLGGRVKSGHYVDGQPRPW